MARKIVDLTKKKKIGNWKILERHPNYKNAITYYTCQCQCGKISKVSHGNLANELSTQCRTCSGSDRKKHGMCGTIEYRRWSALKAVFGKQVCKRWNKFENFLADMGRAPSHYKSSIVRKDPSKGFSPVNCEWGKRVHGTWGVTYTYKGKKFTITELAKLCNITRIAMYFRLQRHPVKRAVEGRPKPEDKS